MPGSGKSTVGVLLAKVLAWDFVDTDLLIQRRADRTLQTILDQDGYLALRQLEAEVLLGLKCTSCVIATGGSAVYSAAAMAHLKTLGPLVFLDVDLDEIERRVTNFTTRGIAKSPDQTFAEVFTERLALYRQHADITIAAAGYSQEQVADLVQQTLRSRQGC